MQGQASQQLPIEQAQTRRSFLLRRSNNGWGYDHAGRERRGARCRYIILGPCPGSPIVLAASGHNGNAIELPFDEPPSASAVVQCSGPLVMDHLGAISPVVLPTGAPTRPNQALPRSGSRGVLGNQKQLPRRAGSTASH